jgi:hypothetical protein
MQDPWRFQRWAFEVTTGNPVRKAVLSMLAMMADKESGRCEAKQATIAAGVEATERAVRGHLKALEEAGLIIRRPQYRRDRGRRGDEFLLLAPGVTEWPDGEPVNVQPEADSGGSPGTDRPHPPAPDDPTPRNGSTGQELPPEEPASEDLKQGENAREDRRLSPPPDFPDELRPHARVILSILERIAEEHQAKRVWPLAVGRLLMRYRHRPLVATVHELDRWAVDPSRDIKDVVATFSTFLSKTGDMQGTERLTEEGLPASGRDRPAGRSATVGHTSSGSKYDHLVQWDEP